MNPSRALPAALACLVLAAGCTSTKHAAAPASSSAAPGVTSAPASQPASPTAASTAASSVAASSPASTSATASSTSASPAPAAHPAAIWPTYHHDTTRAGNAGAIPAVTTLRIAATAALDAAIYASPLVLHDASGDLIIAATENNTVYGLRNNASVVWKQHIGTPVDGSTLPCGDINPTGITGTPVYDPSSGLVYAVAYLSGGKHELVALDAETGSVAFTRAVDPPGATVQVEQQRGALTLNGGRVWVVYGGLAGDCGPYHGFLVGVPTSGQGADVVYRDPGTREGGFWAPVGPAVDAAGNMYVPVGNGDTSGAYDMSDGVIEVSTAGAVVSYFAPASWQSDNVADFGTTGVAMLPNDQVFIAGKSGIAYLLKQGALGGIGHPLASLSVCRSFGGVAYANGLVYLPCTDGVRAVKVSGTTLSTAWHATPAGAPIIGGGVLLSTAQSGTLYALDPATGATKATLKLGDATTRFATPAFGNDGHAYVGTVHGKLVVVATS